MRYILSILFVTICSLGYSQEDCIDPSLIDPDAICTFEFNPVCGCDGVTYSNPCIAETTGGVTEFTFGECGGTVDCFGLEDVDFGECEAVLGIGLIDGECVTISGCGWEVGGIDYSPYSFDSFAACNASCSEQDCLDLGEVDFGECDMVMGIALYEGECMTLSGCGWEVGGIDYSPYAFESIEECNASCSDEDCLDVGGIDFGLCDMAMGIALVNGECVPVSGCDWEVGGIDYSPYFYQNMEDCDACVNNEDCFDLQGIDFGLCTAVLGVGLIDGTCTTISGCGWEVGGIDYSPYFFDTFEECDASCNEPCVDPDTIDPNFECGVDFEPVCGCNNQTYWNACEAQYYFGITSWTEGACSCPDPSVINPDVLCIALYDPVCGCDGVTYGNSCVAFVEFGITEWEPGECGMSVEKIGQLSVNVYPNPVQTTLTIRLENAADGNFELFDISGKTILTGKLNGAVNILDFSTLSSGTYLLKLSSGSAFMQMPVYKID